MHCSGGLKRVRSLAGRGCTALLPAIVSHNKQEIKQFLGLLPPICLA